ncbi:FtsX-like permease family protein [Micromonospora soli]|uniref:FtsX-like permease family protein n=1 Tax=Micromonospora sp. NBRC 110009 TaxID=3061627 RepID=UPI002671DAFB|nr:FtsX-like permease family protein [Micromonospora sp. NBRC 110009]WKT99893.1 FtsX-like permease family protein [Micromonospora sp. NBRC 110009]
MTSTMVRPAPHRAPGGGLPARRAVIRWAVRLFRREWRQQVLTLALLTVAVIGATFAVSATYNMASSSDATFGRADHLLRLDAADPAVLDSRLAAARSWFGTIDAIGHRYVEVPGLFDPVDVRAQHPDGGYGAPMLAVRQGRYPAGAGEVAVTDAVARTLRTGLGRRVSLDGHDRLVVGVVENPKDLTDEFALVDPAHADPPQTVTVLVAGDRDSLERFRATIDGPLVRESRPGTTRTMIAAVTLALATVGLLLVSLVAAAGFIVVAQRRLRQLGMLAAMGATRRHLRLVMLANGTVVGAIAAVLGTAVGVAAWLLVAGRVETAAGHRIDRFDLPWLTLGAGMVLAVATATAAAWWPARAITRTPIMSALSARPPRPRPARRTAVAAVVLLAAGVTCLVLSGGKNPVLISTGTVATAVGVLFVGPTAIRLLAAARGGMPVAVRLALTDLVRYQARAGAALAAISLALGISVAVVAGSAAADYQAKRSAGLGNLAEGQLLVRIGRPSPVIPVRTPEQLASLQAQTDAIARSLGTLTVTPLDRAVVAADTEPGQPGGQPGHPAVEIGTPVADGQQMSSYPLYVATPELLRRYRLDAAAIAADTEVLTVRTGALELVNIPERRVYPKTQALPDTGHSSMPNSLVTASMMAHHGWEPARVGWLVEADHPLTQRELTAVQNLAASAGLTVESRHERASLTSLRTGAVAAGALLALGILAMTVGLIRGEAAGDLRTLTATGAPRRVRRTLTATTAGALALLGAILGVVGAYLGLVSVLHRDLDALTDLPVAHLAATTVGLPVLAAAAGWLLAGREPQSLGRRRLD